MFGGAVSFSGRLEQVGRRIAAMDVSDAEDLVAGARIAMLAVDRHAELFAIPVLVDHLNGTVVTDRTRVDGLGVTHAISNHAFDILLAERFARLLVHHDPACRSSSSKRISVDRTIRDHGETLGFGAAF